jgi:hypothetical protein
VTTVPQSTAPYAEHIVAEDTVNEGMSLIADAPDDVVEPSHAEPSSIPFVDSPIPPFADSSIPPFADPSIPLLVHPDSPYAPEALHEIVEDAIEESIDYVAEEPLPVERHTVYTARYRLVQKGPDRGKWEASVVDEADAPLITVEMVVRGVQRRAGEASATTRYSGAQIARALRIPLPSAQS